jgi:hypothetical protein
MRRVAARYRRQIAKVTKPELSAGSLPAYRPACEATATMGKNIGKDGAEADAERGSSK